MPSPLSIRKAVPADYVALLDLSRGAIDTSFHAVFGDRGLEQLFAAGETWIAMQGEAIAGCSVLRRNRVALLAIDPRWQGRGVGKSLLRHVERELFGRHELIEVESLAGHVDANRFFAQHGYSAGDRYTDESSGQLMVLLRKRAEQTYGQLVAPWTVVEEGSLVDTAVFTLRQRRSTSPESGKTGQFVYLDTGGWVNVIALTAADEVVMIEQFRHGLATVTLEIPGGMIDAGETAEAAGLRELHEETGYAGDDVHLIGRVSSNPAILNNWCSTVLVRGVELRGAVHCDPSEEIAVRLVPRARIDDLIRKRVIHHAIVVAAFHHLHLWGG